MEDVVIVYGFNSFFCLLLNRFVIIGKFFMINKFSDIVCIECVMVGWVEVMFFIFCLYEENFEWFNCVDDGKIVVKFVNFRIVEY